MQPRAGTARHDAVAWGYARGADRRGVDILENCEVTGFLRDGDRITGVTTTRGEIRAKKVAVAVAGSTGRVMQLAGIDTTADREPCAAGLRLGIAEAVRRHASSPSARAISTCRSPTRAAWSIGGDIDGYNSYAQRGNLPIVEEVMSEMLALFPALARVRAAALLGRRHGHVDGRLADHHHRPAARHVSQLRLVLWRLQGDAGLRLVLSPGPSPRTSRTPSTRPSRSTASTAAS